jgi:hypothetical protein
MLLLERGQLAAVILALGKLPAQALILFRETLVLFPEKIVAGQDPAIHGWEPA